jgi:hypothetical protein
LGTKRTPVHRQSRMRITPEAVQLFMASEKHADVYSECIGGGPCQRPDSSRHCDQCRAHVHASRELSRALGLKPWEASPVCPSVRIEGGCLALARDGTVWAASLEQAKRLRSELEAAARAGWTQSSFGQG